MKSLSLGTLNSDDSTRFHMTIKKIKNTYEIRSIFNQFKCQGSSKV